MSNSDFDNKTADNQLANLAFFMRKEKVAEREDEEESDKHSEAHEKTSVIDCFEFALKEMPRRGKFLDEASVARKVDGEPFDKKSKDLTVTEDISTVNLCGRVIDRIMTEILKRPFDPCDEEQDSVLDNLLKTFPSELCSKENIKHCYDELVEQTEGDDNKSSGITNHPLCMNQHAPRQMRVSLMTSASWKAMNYDRREAAIRHLLSEYPHDSRTI